MNSDKPACSPSYPFNTIAVAISLSPYCHSILSEAKHLADALNATLLLIHVGEKTIDKEQEVNEMMKQLNINAAASQVIWDEGKEVKIILEQCDKTKIDLLVLGARVKENVLKFYIGSVARKISRKAKCSVMLVTSPAATPHQYSKIVINATESPQTENTINTALYFAEHLKTKEIYIGQELDLNLSMMSDVQVNTAKQKKQVQPMDELIHSVIKKYEHKGLKITNKTVKGKSGYAISKFAQTKKADLLVVSAPETKLNVMDRIFTHDMEYILANLPCNLLIVHAKA